MADPLSLPSTGFEEFELTPINTRDTAMMEDRRTETAGFGTPYHTLSVQTQYLDDDEYDDVDTFFMEASQAGACFLAHDVFRPRPRAYGNTPLSGTKAGGGAFDGTAAVSAVAAYQATVTGLPDGFQINRGARIGFRMSALVRSLHLVTEAVTADASGVAVVKFKFALDTQNFTTSATVDFEKPSIPMMLDPGFSAPKAWSGRKASFSATEVFFS